jgi:L-fucose isomerase-like protein
MKNIPEIKAAVVGVSRDCFPVKLTRERKACLIRACKNKNIPVLDIQSIIENENDTLTVLEELKKKHVNTLIIYLGNFGPEGPTSMLAQKFEGPVMFAAAAEESGGNLVDGRGDAYCGMLNASYNLGLRNVSVYIPEYPVGTAEEIAGMIADFFPVARILLGIRNLKVFSFGPRPQDFFACNAPIKPLFDVGIEVMENSELDLYDLFRSAEGDPDIAAVARDMADELGSGNKYPGILDKLAQYEIALTRFFNDNLKASEFGAFANKCWPAFERYFGFVPCFVNARLATRGIPVACEVDIYGAVSEYMAACATQLPATLLDINNTVPSNMYQKAGTKIKDYKNTDLFMGFHCGNTSSTCLLESSMKYQLIMKRLLEEDKEPDITRGTLEGRIRPGKVTIFRFQSTADACLRAYVADGEVLDVDPQSFGSIGIFAMREMGRFYRHVIIEKRFPHHTAVAFKHTGKALFSAFKLLGVKDIDFNHPEDMYYPGENPFKR